ncbi:hypothetical protein [Micromonospora sp. KC723]|uniref:hypothetical protein n=1 Tax=Micromonospora sp. KC723 TaxID=2530381 RepID=UPI001FB70BAD|nr:hypothetical protein [Micromonospora sp. KC723]
MPVLLLAIALAGCGGSDENGDGIATAGGDKSASSTESSKPAGPAAFARCMRENGVPDFPDPEPGEGVRIRAPEGADPEKIKSATAACKQHLSNGGDRPKVDAKALERQRDMAKCMRENGVPNFPDPDENGGLAIGKNAGVDVEDPTFKAAEEECRQLNPPPSPMMKEGE